MRRTLLLVAWVALLAGCKAVDRTAVLRSDATPAVSANLALGPSAENSRLAALLPPRSDWPSVDNGYRMDDVTIYTRASYDVQMQYDRQGSLYYEQQSIQTGVRVR
jgi:hypothetical protein